MVAGAKYDTKIGPLNELYKKLDHLILGGVIYNTYLCAKYNIRIAGYRKMVLMQRSHRLSVHDTGLSRQRHGFDSRWHYTAPPGGFFIRQLSLAI